MLLKIHPQNPEERKLRKVVECLNSGGVVIYPTDTVYALGTNMNDSNGIQRIYRIKQLNPRKSHLTIIVADLRQLSAYTSQLSTAVFKLIKQNTPGPVTFILNTNNKLPRAFRSNKKTIGIRIPGNQIARKLLEMYGQPIVTSSLNKYDDEILGYHHEPDQIYDHYHKHVDIVIDGGPGGLSPSTVINCTNDDFEIIRQGVAKNI